MHGMNNANANIHIKLWPTLELSTSLHSKRCSAWVSIAWVILDAAMKSAFIAVTSIFEAFVHHVPWVPITWVLQCSSANRKGWVPTRMGGTKKKNRVDYKWKIIFYIQLNQKFWSLICCLKENKVGRWERKDLWFKFQKLRRVKIVRVSPPPRTVPSVAAEERAAPPTAPQIS